MSDRDDGSLLRSGALRWTVGVIGFTSGACLLVAAAALLLFVVTEYGGQVAGSGRMRSLLALGLFVAAIGIPAYLLAVRSFGTGR